MSRTIACIKSKKNKFMGVARLNIFSNKDKEKKSETIRASLVLENKKISSKKQNKKNRPKKRAINQVEGGKSITKNIIRTKGNKNNGFFLDILTY